VVKDQAVCPALKQFAVLKQNTITIEGAEKPAKYAKKQMLLGVAHETDQNLER
jgi:hypothetical protein